MPVSGVNPPASNAEKKAPAIDPSIKPQEDKVEVDTGKTPKETEKEGKVAAAVAQTKEAAK